MTEAVPPFQFSLRTLLVAVTLAAIGCTFLPTHLSMNVHSLEYRIAAAAVATAGAIAGYAAGRFCGYHASAMLTRRTLRFAGWLFLGLLAATALYLLWAHQRLVDFPDYLDDPLYPRAFPFPDQMLWQYEAWLDVRNPPPPNQFKFHGEIYAVLDHIRILILFGVGMAFFILGLLAPRLTINMQKIAMLPFRRGR